MTEEKKGRGGRREGAGRPVGWRKGYSDARKQHQVRAHDDEWLLIKEFASLVKKDKDKAEKIIQLMQEE